MMELIDQRDPNNKVYRCSECGHSAVSTIARARDGYAWAPTPGGPTPAGWVRHVCQPGAVDAYRVALVAVVASKRKRHTAAPVVAPLVVSDEPPKVRKARAKRAVAP